MNLIPYNSDERYIIYQIEKLDYVTADIANVQPQSLLNTLTFVNSSKSSEISSYILSMNSNIESLSDVLDDVDDSVSKLEDQEDVVDIVADYYALQNYDTSHINNGDIVKVLADINYDNASTYYKWNGTSFVFVSYELNFPHTLLSVDITVTPLDDMTYILMNPITVTLASSGIQDGSVIHLVASDAITTYCTILFNTDSIKLYANMNCELIYYNGSWHSYNYDYEQYRIGDVVLSTSPTCPFNYGTWNLIEEGCALVTGDDNNVTGESTGSDSKTFTPLYDATSGSTVITVAMLPVHSHVIYVSTTTDTHTHTFGYTSASRQYNGSSDNGRSNTSQTTNSGNTGSHTHTVTAYAGLSTVYSSSPAGHTHSIFVDDVTINTMQKSIAYYAWKRIS